METVEKITELTFAEDGTPANERYSMIWNFLRDNTHCIIEFKKKDGSFRSMPCTIDSNFMPPPAVTEFHKTRVIDYETMTVWCEDKHAWRAFKTMNVSRVKVA